MLFSRCWAFREQVQQRGEEDCRRRREGGRGREREREREREGARDRGESERRKRSKKRTGRRLRSNDADSFRPCSFRALFSSDSLVLFASSKPLLLMRHRRREIVQREGERESVRRKAGALFFTPLSIALRPRRENSPCFASTAALTAATVASAPSSSVSVRSVRVSGSVFWRGRERESWSAKRGRREIQSKAKAKANNSAAIVDRPLPAAGASALSRL